MQATTTLPIDPTLFWSIVFLAGIPLVSLLLTVILKSLAKLKTVAKYLDSGWSLLLSGLSRLPQPIALAIVVVITVFLLALAISLTIGLVWTIAKIPSAMPASIGDPDDTSLRWTLLTLTALIGTFGAVIALPLTLYRIALTDRQTVAAEQGLVTDRINAAVQSLGAQKERKIEARDQNGELVRGDRGVPIILEETLPNMEVRIGAILALERIARETPDFHVQITQMLCAYIRENAPASAAKSLIPEGMPEDGQDNQKAWHEWNGMAAEAVKAFKRKLTLRTDIQTALSVIGRRSVDQRAREAGWTTPGGTGAFVFDEPWPN